MANNQEILRDHVYSDILCTPGYDVDFAVVATYSMSMKALLVVPYALGMFGDLGESTRNSALFTLESIRRSADRFAIFCQRGGIQVPKETQSYAPLLEDCIFEVQDKENKLSNFHPKFWIVREVNREDKTKKQIKVTILSKNLTFDSDLDVMVSLTGVIDTENSRNSKKHRPLKEFIETLATEYVKGNQKNKAIKEKRKRILELAADLDRVKRFNVDDSVFEDEGYDFIPFLFGECLNKEVSFPEAFQGHDVMVISPFIDKDTIEKLGARCGKNGRYTLVTRPEYVTEDIFQRFSNENSNVYVMNDQMGSNDYDAVNLHAKCYLVSCPPKDNSIYLCIGSANATKKGFSGNSEMLLRLKYKRSQLIYEKFRNEFLQVDSKGYSLLYEEMCKPTETASSHDYTALEQYVREILVKDYKAHVISSANEGLYNIHVQIELSKRRYDISIAPLQMPTMKKEISSEKIVFEDVPLRKLSEFYIISATDGDEQINEVIKIPTADIPEDRNDNIFMNIVDTKDKLYNYISFMLCEDPEEYAFELDQMMQAQKDLVKNGTSTRNYPLRIYEQMLRIAASDPDQLRNLDDVMRIVRDKDYAKEFIQLYSQFQPLINKLKNLKK